MQAQHCLVGGGDACTQQHFHKNIKTNKKMQPKLATSIADPVPF
jgi:hypothetical protein